jgi:hypothetical protein
MTCTPFPRNASTTKPAKFLVYFVNQTGRSGYRARKVTAYRWMIPRRAAIATD